MFSCENTNFEFSNKNLELNDFTGKKMKEKSLLAPLAHQKIISGKTLQMNECLLKL